MSDTRPHRAVLVQPPPIGFVALLRDREAKHHEHEWDYGKATVPPMGGS
jgi:hypothetical protein